MGYTTEFRGKFELNKPLDEKMKKFLTDFNNSRRMCRDNDMIKKIYPDWQDYCLNGELGINGEFFARPGNDWGQEHDDSILAYNDSCSTQPGLWCQWTPTEDGTAIEWDGGEKFYNYIEWIDYLISKVLEPNGYSLTGTVMWRGEDFDDTGTIAIDNNHIDILNF